MWVLIVKGIRKRTFEKCALARNSRKVSFNNHRSGARLERKRKSVKGYEIDQDRQGPACVIRRVETAHLKGERSDEKRRKEKEEKKKKCKSREIFIEGLR